MKFFSWKWWNEKAIEIPEEYYNWMAPRWYPVLITTIYVIIITMIIDSIP